MVDTMQDLEPVQKKTFCGSALISALGLSFWWTQRNPDGIGILPFSTMHSLGGTLAAYLLFLLVLIVCAVICTLHPKKIERIIDSSSWAIIAISAATSIFLTMLELSPNDPVIRTLSNTVQAVWASAMMMAWPVYIVGLRGRLCFTIPAMSFLLSFVFSFLRQDFICEATAGISEAVLLIFPVLSGIIWYYCFKNTKEQNEFIPSEYYLLSEINVKPLRLIVLVLLTSAAANIVRSFLAFVLPFSPSDNVLLYTFAIVLSGAILLIAIKVKKPNTILYDTWCLIVFLFVASSLFIPSLGNSYIYTWAESVIAANTYLIALFFWLVLTQIARRYSISPILLHGAFEIPLKAFIGFQGAFVVPSVHQLIAPITPSFVITIYFIVVICITAFLLTGKVQSLFINSNEKSSAVNARSEVCSSLAYEFKLSDREREVLELIAEGNSQKKISEILFIAQSTVQTHSKHVYTKMDLHTKQDIIDLVNNRIEQAHTD